MEVIRSNTVVEQLYWLLQ